jgi:nitrogenase subunit NifH
MSTSPQLGIWMDHASAHIMEFNNDIITTKIIKSKFSHREKEYSLSKSESLMHHKEQHEQAQYYNELADIIKNYNHVLLFGPTEA